MSNQSMVRICVACSVVLWALASRREDLQDVATTTTTHEVNLVIVRHGISCSEVIGQWVGWTDYGRNHIPDPLLSVVGEAKSAEIGKDVAQQLKDLPFDGVATKIDGVISNGLAREIQTALLMFPDEAKPVYVAPYLSVSRSGACNKPLALKEQLAEIGKTSVKEDFSVDTQWINVFGDQHGTWPEFLTFLQNSFLPKFIRTSKKQSGEPITLAVVTHASYLKEIDVQHLCGAPLWDDKALNNVAFRLKYKFQSEWPGASSVDTTVRHSLTDRAHACATVTAGVPLEKMSPLCLSDIGDKCIAEVKKYSNYPDSLWDSTSERNMATEADTALGLEKYQKELETKLLSEISLRKAAGQGPPPETTCTRSLMSCAPAEFCERSGIAGCKFKYSAQPDLIDQTIAELKAGKQANEMNMLGSKGHINEFKALKCQAGGSTQFSKYVHLKYAPGNERSNNLLRITETTV